MRFVDELPGYSASREIEVVRLMHRWTCCFKRTCVRWSEQEIQGLRLGVLPSQE